MKKGRNMKISKKKLEEFRIFLEINKREAEEASRRFDQASKRFDETMRRIRAAL